MTGPKRPWTDEEVKTAVAMREAGARYTEIGAALGRHKAGVRTKLVEEQRRTTTSHVVETLRVPEHVLAERDRRYALTPCDLTALLLGDPLPGYRALDRALEGARRR